MHSIKLGVRCGLLAGAAISSLCGAGVAWAQVTPPADSSSSGGLEEVTVTAQRRSEDIQQAPLSMTAISPQQLENLNLVSIESIELVTPGLVFNSGYNFAQPFIRGVGTNLPTTGLDGAVALYVDGAYQTNSFGSATDLFDVSSVQVLKGPQGTLWGRNASGGAIIVTTADPTSETSVDVAAEYGRFDHVLGEAVFNAPLSDTLAIRVGARHSEDDGFITNLFNGNKLGSRKADTGRVKLRWAPTDSFSAVLGFEYGRNVQSVSLATRGPASTCLLCVATEGLVQPVSGFYQANIDDDGPIVIRSRTGNLQLSYDAGALSVQSTTAFRNQESSGPSDQDFSPLDVQSFQSASGGKTFTQEVLISTNNGRVLNGLLGVSYLDSKDFFHARISGGPGTDLGNIFAGFGEYPFTNNEIDTTSYSAFLDAYLTPVERLKITLGGRYTHDSRDFSIADNLAGGVVGAGGFPPVALNQSTSTDSSAFTPRVVFAYELTNVNLYASWNRGYKSGGFSTPVFDIVPENRVDPEHIDSYEVGAKFVSDDRRVRANAAAFYYKYTDIQVSVIVNINSTALPFTQNAASAEAQGLEFDGSFALTDRLTLMAGGSYLDADFTSFPSANISVPAVTGGLAQATADLKDTPLPRSPEYTYYLGGSLKQPIGDSWQASLNALLHYTAGYEFHPGRGGPLGFDYQPAYTLVNLTGDIGPRDERYSVGLYVNNLTDEKYYVQKQSTAPLALADTVAPPRTYGVRLTAKF